jgi:quercetin dioxygenase-like cupin family protein
MNKIYAFGRDEGLALWFLNTLTLVKATAEQTGGAFCMIEQRAPVGSGSPFHVHHAEDETFYVMDGELEFFRDGGRTVGGPGSYVYLPRDIPHGFRVIGGSPARFLITCTPGRFSGFVTEFGEPAKALRLPEPTAPDMDRLGALAAKYDIELLGPLPD